MIKVIFLMVCENGVVKNKSSEGNEYLCLMYLYSLFSLY